MPRIVIDQRGFSLLEAVIATALIGIFISACAVGLTYGVRSTKDAGRKQQAVYLAEEGLAAAQNMRDDAYANLTNGTWGITTTGSQWNFSGSSDATSIFTRSVTVADSGIDTKEITSTVTWTDTSQRAQSISLLSYLSDWRSATTSPWTTAALAGAIDLSGNQNMVKVQSVGNYAYAIRDASSSANFLIIDISTPTAPTTVGSLLLSGTPSNIVVSGNYAYVTSSDNSQEVQIVNIAIPAVPVLVGSYNASGSANANGVALSGTNLFVVRNQSSNAELLVLDVTNPLLPTLSGSLDVSDNANDIVIAGNYAYIASSINTQELQVIDVSTPTAPVLLGGYDLSGSSANANAVVVSGTMVYVGIASSLYVLDDSTHGAPVLSATLAQGGTVNDIALMDGIDYLFIASSYGSGEFRMVDVTTPASPAFLVTLDLDLDVNGVAYNASLDSAVAVSSSNTAEIMTITHP